MKRTRMHWLIVFILVLSAFLTACSSNDKAGTNKKEGSSVETSNKPQDGGTLVYALDSQPKGLFNWTFYEDAVDHEVLEFFDENLIDYDEHLKAQPHIASWTTEDNKVFKFTIKKGVKWHNGDELSVKDWEFALYTIANKDYEGSRFENVRNIVGAQDYRDGKTDKIEGIKVIDDYNIEITFDKARVNNLDNLWTYPMNRNAFKGIEVKDMLNSEVVRTKPVGLGPFKVTKVVPGESIEMERFDDYFGGKPHIEKVVIKVIDPSLSVGELKNGTLDMTSFHPSIIDQVKALDNVEAITYPGVSYYYVGFRLGTWDGEKNVMNEPKYQDKKLREAMYYAINREEWVKAFFFGVGKPVNRPIPSNHWIAADQKELKQYKYDPNKAKKLLDEAGYKDVNGDGYREDPNGKEFVINFSHYATQNPTFEARAKALAQYWEEVGLKTKLTMTDVNLYYDLLDKADKSMEVFFGGWSTGADPDPTPLWGSKYLWNYPRWVNEESDKLLDQALDISVVGTDNEKRKNLYVEWQKLFMEELPILPITELEETMAVSKRVQGVKFDVSGYNRPHEWWIKQ
ncbi:oligopeptide ABC transporter substrate-binding protein [Bacillus thermocopriae]|uniref:Oligopeptide ABC transporter substrate-binding protein n=1 Tax=Neobacillus thermocopriae TaxID=1215031 RepID=A0A6B3TR60_9BACI|nr:oligopeptide ABC transporter substrate-binding protein [Neobacillus thermocopriae]MED3623111.1 ABC transporter substrate-binding protein [Neobacillus thermocopriae]MED3715006.1 ABC transporter substrate-binding protein [Neobacillus thermocopriae]NEX78860.1 oligopeptide ABC transporter substrate-binding protein [Neobacillus thermocopriae]